MIITAGIDPGKSGALAVIADGKNVMLLEKAPLAGTRYLPTQMTRMLLPFSMGAEAVNEVHGAYHNAVTKVLSQMDAEDDSEYWEAVDALKLLHLRLRAQAPLSISLLGIEKQGVRPGEGGKSSLTTGRGWGLWEGVVSGLGIPCKEFTAQRWQAAYKLNNTGTKSAASDATKKAAKKALHVSTAAALFPGVSLKRTEDGKADALLIAHHAYRWMLNRSDG
jgi:hypothetical protein